MLSARVVPDTRKQKNRPRYVLTHKLRESTLAYRPIRLLGEELRISYNKIPSQLSGIELPRHWVRQRQVMRGEPLGNQPMLIPETAKLPSIPRTDTSLLRR
ncbi:hypothetical protein MiSe_77940 [Microseira wollei NIES-4236]|uniref:Transposase n=1 Tax=Microseira wollei NIES-4236 TaxID=2530354 RepID=A0AAV3XQD2_9CYAN|nr:hypothetical protein MiSe_77940 [Microseira wollei NIES-4236]